IRSRRAAPAPPRRFPPREADPVLDSRDRRGKPDRTCALSLPLPAGEILQGVHRPTLTARLEVQLIAVRIRVAQLGDLLSFAHRLALVHQQLAIVGIGGEN